KTKSETERSKEKTPETKRALRPPNAMPLLHGASLRALLAGAAVAHLSSFPIVRASPCAPPQPLRLRAFASHSASEPPPPPPSSPSPSTSRVLASAAAACDCEEGAKPAICTADELHYAPVPGTEWRLALWRYRPPPEAPKRNHPLMLLSGVATNAVGFDLSPGASFARHMSMQGFDTWIVELRGAGLSTRGSELAAASTKSDMSSNSDKFLGLMELPQTSAIYDQISQLSQRLVKILGEGQQNVSPRLFGWQERLSATIEDLQKQLELIISYDWDFDHYLEEDVPAAVCRHTLYCREIN
uniref:AB hydrolase-1 domain-containing protein n=1 Tax=Aegilops tauschii subsp. strangulata TaxID=200361 RepID=A0A453FB68_AEGTS